MIAKLPDGRTIEYHPKMIGEGATKQVYFTKDRQAVICFYKNPNLSLTRLQKILTVFNPTITDKYWQELFCWPTNIVVEPKLGVIVPTYPPNFFFATGRWQGKAKKSRWFISPKLRNYLPIAEQGSWIDYFKISILLSRAVNRLHLSGLAHSDLSDNNILIDPSTGKVLITDLDTLVVPQTFAPEVNGTPNYIAPEVLTTIELSVYDPKKNLANIYTDQHALAVLLYEYLLNRHPLRGPKVNSINSAEQDEYLSMGKKAIFIEHPSDFSNHLATDLPLTILGPTLVKLFYRAFVTGLHSPHLRPSAYQWEKALVATWDKLYPCSNCKQKWFVVTDLRCSFCNTPIAKSVPILTIWSQTPVRSQIGELVVYDGKCLFSWHVFDNIFPTHHADKTPLAYCVFHQGKWLLINQLLPSLSLATGELIKLKQAVELKSGLEIYLSKEAHGCTVRVNI